VTEVPAYLPDAGDLIWMDFDPAKGRERARLDTFITT
jgi:hypothetical protein